MTRQGDKGYIHIANTVTRNKLDLTTPLLNYQIPHFKVDICQRLLDLYNPKE